MEEMPIPASPMEMIGMDFIGPFPMTDLGYRYAITIIDYHTGWAEVYPTRDQSAREIVRVFAEEFMPLYLDQMKSPSQMIHLLRCPCTR